LFDRPKTTVGCSASGRRRRRSIEHKAVSEWCDVYELCGKSSGFSNVRRGGPYSIHCVAKPLIMSFTIYEAV
jgi:hypothetical protein